MTLHAHERHQATLQFASCLTLGTVLAVTGVRMAYAPADGPKLSVPIGELRSQAAEVAELQRRLAAGELSSRFVRLHSTQLAKSTSASYRELSKLEVQPQLADTKRRALDEARPIVAAVDTLRAGRGLSADDIERRRDALIHLEREIDR